MEMFQHSLMNLGVETRLCQRGQLDPGRVFQHSLMNLGVETPRHVCEQKQEIACFSIL